MPDFLTPPGAGEAGGEWTTDTTAPPIAKPPFSPFYDIRERVYVDRGDGTLRAGHQVDVAVLQRIRTPKGAIRHLPDFGLDLARIRASHPARVSAVAVDAVAECLSVFVKAGDISLDSVEAEKDGSAVLIEISYTNLRTREPVTLTQTV